MLTALKTRVSGRSREWRAKLFRSMVRPAPDSKILDLGGGSGRHMALHYPELRNIHIADFNEADLRDASDRYGFTPHLVDGAEKLPFDDNQFDVVFCSSVIEHVTGEKRGAAEAFKRDGQSFRRNALRLQERFASEIRRIGRAYFVQTPAKEFPIETHSWLPLTARLPSHRQWQVMRLVNRIPYPRKQTMPDWSLLSHEDFQRLFPAATIVREKMFGFTKSYIAVGGDLPVIAGR